MGDDGPGVVRVVWGTGTGPTAISSYDAALTAAGVGDYNLVRVSSILPANAELDVAGVAPPLGPAGNRLWVVEARATAEGPDRAVAGLSWATGPGPGLFYEVGRTDGADEAAVADELERGLAACEALRSWRFDGTGSHIESVEPDADEFATAVVLGVFGAGEPIL